MLEPLGEEVYYATVTHQGSGNLALWSVDENGQDLDLMVNGIGNYEGQVAVKFSEDPAAIRVEADGEWAIDLVHITEAPRWDGDSAYEATGDSIVIVDGVADGLTPVTLTHAGESNFAIWAWGESYPDLIVNDIGLLRRHHPAARRHRGAAGGRRRHVDDRQGLTDFCPYAPSEGFTKKGSSCQPSLTTSSRTAASDVGCSRCWRPSTRSHCSSGAHPEAGARGRDTRSWPTCWIPWGWAVRPTGSPALSSCRSAPARRCPSPELSC